MTEKIQQNIIAVDKKTTLKICDGFNMFQLKDRNIKLDIHLGHLPKQLKCQVLTDQQDAHVGA